MIQTRSLEEMLFQKEITTKVSSLGFREWWRQWSTYQLFRPIDVEVDRIGLLACGGTVMPKDKTTSLSSGRSSPQAARDAGHWDAANYVCFTGPFSFGCVEPGVFKVSDFFV